jgi:hypothetical protein
LDPQEEVPRDPSGADPLAAALQATTDGRLLAVTPDDGTVHAAYGLDSPPVFDGMAAASGCLYLSTKAGTVICLDAAE